MPRFMLDTDTCSYIMKRSHPLVLKRLQSVPVGDICMSVVTKAELLYGVEVSPRRAQDAAALAAFLPYVEVVALDDDAPLHYAEIRADLKRRACSVRVVTRDGIANEGITLRIAAPDGTSGDATTDQNGMVSSELPALAGLAGQPPIGAWRIEVTGGPSLLDGATLKVDRVYNIQFGLEYSFDFAPEVI